MEKPAPTPSQSTGRGKTLLDGSRSGGKTLSSSPTSSSASTAASPVKKKKKAATSTKTDHYTNYIFKLLRQIKPGVRITRRAMSIMNSFVLDAFERIAAEAGKLCAITKRDTLTSNEVRTAVRLVLPGELAKHAIIEGVAAVQAFTGSPEVSKRV